MSTPAPALILVCPTCGKKYQGDPTKPNAKYRCPADQADLVRPDAVAAAPTKIISDEVKPPAPPAPPARTTVMIDPPVQERTQKIEVPKEPPAEPEHHPRVTQQMDAP